MFHVVFHNELDYERSPIGYASHEAAFSAGRTGISVGAGWSGFHIEQH